ncbi:MAG: hypothetical protein QFX34_04735 [Candidatus Verstraetearchaeota archaeon]|nr:hypothetical protein [Candidatus Verstraetearchaeota archaeon]
MRLKVFIETSVLIEGAIYLAYKIADNMVRCKREHYDDVMQLFSLFEKNPNKRVGLTTKSVEEEAYKVLYKVIERTLMNECTEKEVLFQVLSVAQDICESRLRKLLRTLVIEPVDEELTKKYWKKVKQVYELLEQEAKDKNFGTEKKVPVPRSLRWEEISKIYQRQEQQMNLQLINLINKPIETSDIWILSEAVYLFNLLKETLPDEVDFYFASLDHHFVPYYRSGRKISGQIAEEIKRNFLITADDPRHVYEEVKSRL